MTQLDPPSRPVEEEPSLKDEKAPLVEEENVVVTEDPVDEKAPVQPVDEDASAPELDIESDAEETPDVPPPQPARVPRWRKRLALVILVCFVVYLALTARKAGKKPTIVYATRYSKEHKFRPAASPIITETLKDGRVRLRGAHPTATPEPTPTAVKPKGKRKGVKGKKRKPASGKVSGKRRDNTGTGGTRKTTKKERRTPVGSGRRE